MQIKIAKEIVKNLVIVATEFNSVFAFDAGALAAPLKPTITSRYAPDFQTSPLKFQGSSMLCARACMHPIMASSRAVTVTGVVYIYDDQYTEYHIVIEICWRRDVGGGVED